MKLFILTSVERKKMKKSLLFLAAAVLFFAVGCSSMNSVKPMSADIDSKVKNLQPPSDKALVYVVRPTYLGKPFGGEITANGEYVGTTQGGIYVYAVLNPDTYTFEVTGHDNKSQVEVSFEAGKTYYIHQGVYPGIFKGITKLRLVSDEEGKKALDECQIGDKLGENTAH